MGIFISKDNVNNKKQTEKINDEEKYKKEANNYLVDESIKSCLKSFDIGKFHVFN